MSLHSSTTIFSSLIAQARRPDRWAKTLALAIGAGSLAAALHPAVASAETAIACSKPEVQVSTGRVGPGDKPRVTVLCTGGTNVMPIQYFAFELASSETLALLIERVAGTWAYTNSHPLYILTNLSDTSGAAWGCGAANCRILDYVDGY